MICIGDFHADKLKNLFPENHLDLQINEVKKAIDVAMRLGESHLCFLGDLSENIRLSVEAECKLIKFFLELDNKINVHVILGNHDFAENGNHALLPFFELQRQKVFSTINFYDKPTTKKIEGVLHNFCPYPFTEANPSAINYGHFEVSGSTRDNGTKIKKAHDIDEKENWIMGHLHTPHDVGNTHYVGTLYQLNFGESLPKYFSIVNGRTKNGKLKVKKERHLVSPAFKLINLAVENEKDLKKIDKNPLNKYRLLLSESFATDLDVMEKYPNVVKIDGYKTKQEMQALIEESFLEITEQRIELPSWKDELKIFLKNKQADKKTIKRALAIHNEIRNT